MKIRLLLLFLPFSLSAATGSWNGVAFTAWNGVAQTAWNGTAISCASSASYLINEGFEEANTGGALGSSTDGYDSPLAAGIIGSGTVTNKYTPALVGSFSLNADNAKVYWTTPSDRSEVYLYFQFKCAAIPENPYLVELRKSGTAYGYFRLLTGGTVRIYNGSTSADTVAAMSVNTLYHCWYHWKTDGIASGGFTTTGTYPTGNNLASVTGGNGTTAIANIFLGSDGADPMIFDHFLVSTNAIGNNP